MAVKKKFPYRAAVVACNGVCAASAVSKCRYGCVGCGICAAVCKFGAVTLNENGVAVVDEEKCIACGMCARPVSCIGCGICEKTCTAEAVRVVDNHAVIDETLCLSCGMCAVKCPRRAIADLRGVLTEG